MSRSFPTTSAQRVRLSDCSSPLYSSGAEALITVRCGENAAQVLKAADIRIYKSKDGTALENAAALEAGELGELTHFHAGFQGIQ